MNHSSPSVLFVSSWYPGRHHPALGNFVQRHVVAASRCCRVAVLSASASDTIDSGNFEIITSANDINEITVYYRKVNSRIPLWSGLLRAWRYFSALKKGFAVYRTVNPLPDLIHLHVIFPAGLFVLYLKYRYKLSYLVTEHSTAYHSRMSFTNRILARLAGNQAALVCPVSNHLGEAMKRAGIRTKMLQVSNVVNTSLFYYAPKSRSGKIKIIHVSTLNDRQKNISGMLRVIKRLAGAHTGFEVHVISELDPQHAVDYAASLGILDSFVFFHNYMPVDQVAQHMRSSDFFLMFSNYENQPCVLLEALCCGLPAVATTVGGIPEIINEHNGLLAEPGNENDLFEKTLRMMGSHANYEREKISREAASLYSYEAVGNILCSLYQRLATHAEK